MKIQLNESDIQSIIATAQKRSILFTLTGADTFEIKFPFGKAKCELESYSQRSITIAYHLGIFTNLLANWLGKINQEGMLWDKKNRQIHLDPIFIMQSQNKAPKLDILIRKLHIDQEGLFIDLDLLEKRPENQT